MHYTSKASTSFCRDVQQLHMCCDVISVIAASSLFSTFNLNLVLSSSSLSHCGIVISTASSPCYFTVISYYFTINLTITVIS